MEERTSPRSPFQLSKAVFVSKQNDAVAASASAFWDSQMKKAELTIPFRMTSNRCAQREAFAKEISYQCVKHGEKPSKKLLREISQPGERHAPSTLWLWAKCKMTPRIGPSFQLLNRLEERYKLPKNYFRDVLHPLTPTELVVRSVSSGEQNVVRRHLPLDFDARSHAQQKQIVLWLRNNVLHGGSEYGARLQEYKIQRYALRYPRIFRVPAGKKNSDN